MNWHDYIVSDPAVLAGKPIVKNTRLAVDFILGLFAQGWTEQQVLANYPNLSKESLQAIFSFSAECMKDEAIFSLGSEISA